MWLRFAVTFMVIHRLKLRKRPETAEFESEMSIIKIRAIVTVSFECRLEWLLCEDCVRRFSRNVARHLTEKQLSISPFTSFPRQSPIQSNCTTQMLFLLFAFFFFFC